MRSKRLVLLPILALISLMCTRESEEPCNLNEHVLSQLVKFPVSAAVEPAELYNFTPYARIVETQYNSITAETIMKAEYLHPQEGVYFWNDADRLVQYGIAHNKRLHGHTLIWHQQLPSWIRNYQGSKNDWDILLRDHVQTIVSHFKGQVSGWEVVNEAFNRNIPSFHTAEVVARAVHLSLCFYKNFEKSGLRFGTSNFLLLYFISKPII